MTLHVGVGQSKGHLNRRSAGLGPSTYSADFTTPSYSGAAPQNSNASGGYIDDLSGNWSFVSPNTLRRSNKGLLIEGIQTNAVRNSAMQGAVAGSPGTPPTNMGVYGLNGLSYQIVGSSVRNGIDGTLFRLFGTTTAGGNTVIQFETSTAVVAAQNDLWSLSTFHQRDAGSLSGITSIGLTINEATSTGGYLQNGSATITPTTTLKRDVCNRTLANASTARIYPTYTINYNSGAVIDVTFWIGWPQLERMDNYAVPSRGVTSPIRTVGTAAARSADSVTITLPNGVTKVVYTFDDNTTQQVSASGGSYTIPANLNRPYIKSLLAS